MIINVRDHNDDNDDATETHLIDGGGGRVHTKRVVNPSATDHIQHVLLQQLSMLIPMMLLELMVLMMLIVLMMFLGCAFNLHMVLPGCVILSIQEKCFLTLYVQYLMKDVYL